VHDQLRPESVITFDRNAQITGRILDPNGRPVPGTRVEIWRCDSNGRYHYMSGMVGPISRATRISRVTRPRQPIRAAFNRNNERTDLALPLAALHDPLTNC
jgi:hypothetical protein